MLTYSDNLILLAIFELTFILFVEWYQASKEDTSISVAGWSAFISLIINAVLIGYGIIFRIL